jgi:curved DNA-binding protein
MGAEFKDYYAILGVSKTASADELKKSYRQLARQYHPDVATDKRHAEEKFKEINEAYQVLGDPDNRRKYDTLGADWNQPGGVPGGQGPRSRRRSSGPAGGAEFQFDGTGFSDFFEQFFGHQNRGTETRGGPRRGADVEGDLAVDLNEVLLGAVRSISLRQEDPRTGEEEITTFRVRIPAGVRDGRVIRVAGKGEEGHGGVAGDLLLRVRLVPHPDFQVRGDDLVTELELAPWEIILGVNATVQTLEGPVTIRVPAGSVPGQQLRVRGKGLPLDTGSARGDLFAVLTVTFPTEVNDGERELWKKLAELSTFNPRKRTGDT